MTEFEQIKFPGSGIHSHELARGREMEVLCGCDERYLPHAATMLCSLLEHDGVSRVHFLHGAIVDRELLKLAWLVERYGSELVCYEMIPHDFDDLRVDIGSSQSSIANYFRLLAPRMLPANLKKILYLDSDIVVRRSLSNLWNTELRGHALAAVVDSFWCPEGGYVELPPGAPYFNSGVLLINLDYWRQNNIVERTIEFVRNNPHKVNFYDQDALNAVLVDRWISVPATWNDHSRSTLHLPPLRNRDILDPAVVHFVGGDKPWNWLCKHPFKHEYHKYRLKTPWRWYTQKGPYLPERIGSRLRALARLVLPGGVRQWLRSRIISSRA